MPWPEKFRETLQEQAPSLKAMIYEGYEGISGDTPAKQRAAFWIKAMETLDAQLDFESKAALMGANACCTDGPVGELLAERAERAKCLTLPERLEIYNSDEYCKASMNDDGTLTVSIHNRRRKSYFCSCWQFDGLRKIPELSSTYCMCCAGNLRFHCQNVLGLQLKLKDVTSSCLNNAGKEPCAFIFEIC